MAGVLFKEVFQTSFVQRFNNCLRRCSCTGLLLNSEPSRRNTLTSVRNLHWLVCSKTWVGRHLQVGRWGEERRFWLCEPAWKICAWFYFCLPACLPPPAVKSCGCVLERHQGHCCSYRLSIHSEEKRKEKTDTRQKVEMSDIIAPCYYIIGLLRQKKKTKPSFTRWEKWTHCAAVVVMKSGRLLLDFYM